jgi:hypothetical protein
MARHYGILAPRSIDPIVSYLDTSLTAVAC